MTMERAEQHPGLSDDWAARVTGWVEHGVDLVKDHSVRPVLWAVKAAIVGLLVALISLFVVTASSIGIVRLLTADAFGGRVWASDLVVGGIFAAAGAFLLARGRAQRSEDDER